MKRLLIIMVICIAAINGALVVSPIGITATILIADAFIVIFALVLLFSLLLAKKSIDNSPARKVFFGEPIFRTGIRNFVIAAVMNLVFIVISGFYSVAPWIVIVANIILLAGGFIHLILVDSSRNFVEQQRVKREYSTSRMKEMRLQSNQLVAMCNDPNLQKKVKHMADAFRYSDPNSNFNDVSMEEELKSELDALERLINTDEAHALLKIEEIERLLKKRNAMVLSSK